MQIRSWGCERGWGVGWRGVRQVELGWNADMTWRFMYEEREGRGSGNKMQTRG